MQAEIKFIPQEGAKSLNKAQVRAYDSQGIMFSEADIAQTEDPSTLETTVDVPRNGRVEIKGVSTAEFDMEEKSAVPPEEELSSDVKEALKKKTEEKERRRQEGLHEAALQRGLAYERPPQYPGGTPGAHVERKDDNTKVDASKNPNPALTSQPKENPTARK